MWKKLANSALPSNPEALGIHKMAVKLIYSLFLVTSVCSLSGQENDEVAATPQRPSFGTSAATTEKGWFELEAGISADEDVFDSPLLLKIGAARNLELFAGVAPVVGSGREIETISAGSRWRFRNGGPGAPSLAGQVSITTFRSDFAEKIDTAFLFILSHVVEEVAIDFNAGLNLPDSGGEQIIGILTLGKPIGSKFGGYAEIFATHSFEQDEQIFIASFGASYAVTPRLVFDSALNLDISNAGFDFQFLVGATSTLAKIW